MASYSQPVIRFKRGDDFKLDLTVTDKNNTTAIAAAALVVVEQATYDALLLEDPQVPQDIADQLVVLNDAIAAYDLSIIVDITNWTITSNMAWRGKAIASFTITIIDALLGTFTISIGTAVTALWDPRTYDCDIQFVRPEGKVSSETMKIIVERSPTNV